MKNQERKKMILRYAAIIALGEKATDQEKNELINIEDQLHLSRDSILREATVLGLSQIR